MQYLVSVIDDGAGRATPTEDADIDVFNEKLQAEGHWVFAGGLGAATVVDNRGEEAIIDRRAISGIEGVPRRILDHRGARSRRGADAGRQWVQSLQPETEVRPFLA